MGSSIGERVKQVRGALNQRDFAELLGVAKGSISQIEQGKAMPSGDFLLKIKQALDVDMNWLLTGMGSAGLILNPRETALLDNYRHSSQEGQDAIEKVALVAAKPNQELVASEEKAKTAS